MSNFELKKQVNCDQCNEIKDCVYLDFGDNICRDCSLELINSFGIEVDEKFIDKFRDKNKFIKDIYDEGFGNGYSCGANNASH